jgi:microcystin-dependent protein
MKKIILAVCSGLYFSASAQVGIGTVAPDNNSILDLRNTNNRGLVLPQPTGTPPNSPTGVMFYDPNIHKIVILENGGYNAVSPWRYKYNGSSSENTYYNETGNVGIGNNNPQRKFHVTKEGAAAALEGTSSTYMEYYPQGFSNGRKGYVGYSSTSNADLYIKNEASNRDILLEVAGSGRVMANAKIYERGFVLLPAGSIVMWSGPESAIPAGWQICNGSGSYITENGTNYSIPDLRGRFIVGYDDRSTNGNSTLPANATNMQRNYKSIGNIGGLNSVELDLTQMPRHNHGINDPGHSHTYRKPPEWEHHSTDDDDNEEDFYDNEDEIFNTNASTSATTTGITIKFEGGDGNGNATEAGEAHENRPEYYVLAYIIKLR